LNFPPPPARVSGFFSKNAVLVALFSVFLFFRPKIYFPTSFLKPESRAFFLFAAMFEAIVFFPLFFSDRWLSFFPLPARTVDCFPETENFLHIPEFHEIYQTFLPPWGRPSPFVPRGFSLFPPLASSLYSPFPQVYVIGE